MSNWTDQRVADWAKEHFANSPISGVWAPDGTGLIFLKTDEKKWSLMRAVDHEATKDTLNGIRTLMFDLGYTLNEDETQWDDAPETMEQAMAIEEQQKKDIANSWADADGMKLSEMNPEERFPSFVEEKEVLLDNGDTETIDVWTYLFVNEDTGTVTELDPDDYRILVDDRHFMRYKNSEDTVFQALTRREMMEYGDANILGVVVGSKCPDTGEKVPPWLWGTYCRRLSSVGEEE
tara:strand:- start:1014 stop:1718 length:705 start_codon:yes stop_codon:yes gene_type:complete